MSLLNLFESREAREQRQKAEQTTRAEQARIRQQERESRVNAERAGSAWTRLFGGDRHAAGGNPYPNERQIMTRIICRRK